MPYAVCLNKGWAANCAWQRLLGVGGFCPAGCVTMQAGGMSFLTNCVSIVARAFARTQINAYLSWAVQCVHARLEGVLSDGPRALRHIPAVVHVWYHQRGLIHGFTPNTPVIGRCLLAGDCMPVVYL